MNYVVFGNNFFSLSRNVIPIIIFVSTLVLMSVTLVIQSIVYLVKIKIKNLNENYKYPVIYLVLSLLSFFSFLSFSTYYFRKNRFEFTNIFFFDICYGDIFAYILVLSMFIFINYTFVNVEKFITDKKRWQFRLSCCFFVINLVVLFFLWRHISNECLNCNNTWRAVYDKDNKKFLIPKELFKDGVYLLGKYVYRVNAESFILKFIYSNNVLSSEMSFLDYESSRFVNLFELTSSHDLILNQENMARELGNFLNDNLNKDKTFAIFDWHMKVAVMEKSEILSLIKDIKDKFGVLNDIFNKNYNEQISKIHGIKLNNSAFPHDYIYGGKNCEDQSVFIYDIIRDGQCRVEEKVFYKWGFGNYGSLREYVDFLIYLLENDHLTVGDFEIFRIHINRLLQDVNFYLSVATEEEKILISPDSIDLALDSLKKLVWEIGKVTWTIKTDNVKII